MALTPEVLQADLDALERAINLGATRVQYQDRVMNYRSLGEMSGIARRLRVQLGQATAGPRRTVARTSNGLGGDSAAPLDS